MYLRRLDLNDQESVYTSILRSVVKFYSVVHGPLLTKDQGELLERLQSQSLKIAYVFERQILEASYLQRSEKRRREIAARQDQHLSKSGAGLNI